MKVKVFKEGKEYKSVLTDGHSPKLTNWYDCISDVYDFVKRVVGPVVGHGTSETAYKKLLNSVRNARSVEKAMFTVTSFCRVQRKPYMRGFLILRFL